MSFHDITIYYIFFVYQFVLGRCYGMRLTKAYPVWIRTGCPCSIPRSAKDACLVTRRRSPEASAFHFVFEMEALGQQTRPTRQTDLTVKKHALFSESMQATSRIARMARRLTRNAVNMLHSCVWVKTLPEETCQAHLTCTQCRRPLEISVGQETSQSLNGFDESHPAELCRRSQAIHDNPRRLQTQTVSCSVTA